MQQTQSERDGIGTERQRDLAAAVLAVGAVIGTAGVAVGGRPQLAAVAAIVGAVTWWLAGRI